MNRGVSLNIRPRSLSRDSQASSRIFKRFTSCIADKVCLMAPLIGTVPVLAPFFDVAMHIIQTPGIGGRFAHMKRNRHSAKQQGPILQQYRPRFVQTHWSGSAYSSGHNCSCCQEPAIHAKSSKLTKQSWLVSAGTMAQPVVKLQTLPLQIVLSWLPSSTRQ